MSPAKRILAALDGKLNCAVELTLYGRAAIQLGFDKPPAEAALSRDVDAVLWLGQAEELEASTNFWEAVDEINREFAGDGFYISHLFTEDQVVLRPEWRSSRSPIIGGWKKLTVWRLGDADLFLSKLMRDDPLDRADADFIVRQGRLNAEEIREAIRAARVPEVPEVREQFAQCIHRFL